MKKILYTFILVGFLSSVQAQQLPFTTPIQEMHHFWNPAFTAPGNDLIYSGFFRKQWVGFDNAPSTAFASIQYPFIDMNMSAGAAIVSDKTGPVSKLGLQLNYSYKLREILRDDDHLSLGVSAYFHQYRFNPSAELFNQSGDPLLNDQTESKFNPSFGLGFAYFSHDKEFDRENIFYVGFSSMQFLSGELLLETGDAKRERHYFGNLGIKFFSYDSYIEPSIQLSFVKPEIIDIVVGAKYEMEDTFWAGLNYSTVNDLSFSGGVIMKDVGGRYRSLRMGVLAAFNAGELLQAGPSLEFFAAYKFDID